MLDAANTDGQLIFYADSSNWMSSIRSQLVNWGAYLSDFDARIAAGFTLLIHKDGATSVGSFVGGGLYQLLLAPTAPTLPSASGLITGGLKGGVVSTPVSVGQTNYSNYNGPKQTGNQQFQPTSPDPVGLCAGNLYYNHDDLTVGSGNFPYSLTFSRSYNSNNCFVNGPIGLAWTHNFFTYARLGSNGLRACGEFSPKEAAAAIAHSFVMIQLGLNDSATLTQLLIASQSTFWLMNQMASNSVTINDGGNSREYVLLVDGTTYNPAPGYVETLTLSAGAYTLTNPQQQQWIFNTDGTLATYVDPAALTGSTYTLSLSYSGGLLTSVTNGLGRTLNFTYSGFVLQSVSDGNGRSVSFGFDAYANLTTFSDTTGATIRYDYNLVQNLPGLLAQIFLPDNPSAPVMSTFYDIDLIVQQQSSANFYEPELTTNFQFAGSRTATIDPLGNTFARYTNSLGSVVREINELGQVTSYEFDGLNRVISITYPELNQLLLTYDHFNNVLTKTWVAKPGSSLPNIVQSFTYESTWNRLATFEDGEGNITTYSYDPTQGTLLSITRPTIGGMTPTVVFTYNSRGQVLTKTDETGIVDFFVYDSSTEVLLSATRDYGTGHLNLLTSLGYDAIGNV
ncbi:MAG: hypothetical protein K2X81_15650, partial [Candidatus Obscuribacterales bacterium]|nr:hypothetical protein [Candidatus Obscuribacterales bacterium]